jgi:hypothetical protein
LFLPYVLGASSSVRCWLVKHLLPTDRVVIGSTTNAWYGYDWLEPLMTKVLAADLLRDIIVLLQCFDNFYVSRDYDFCRA